MKLPIETPNHMFGKYLYPTAKKIMESQQDVAWTAPEIVVEKDKADYKQKMTPAQLNLCTVTLQTFVEIEQSVGDVWTTLGNWFPHSEIEGCCMEFARMEKSVHAFFYQKMSDVLNIDPEETAKNQQEIQALKSKLTFIKKITSNLDDDKLLSLATISAIEQVLLFSNFAMLKSFQSNGNNLIKTTITGVDFVVQDEHLHGDFAAYLFNTYKAELIKHDKSFKDDEQVLAKIHKVIKSIVKHEDAIIEYSFAGETAINDITAHDLKTFVRSRANMVLENLGYSPIYDIESNPIAQWFYKGTSSIKMHDFFVAGTNQYRRSWKVDNFSALPFLKADNE